MVKCSLSSLYVALQVLQLNDVTLNDVGGADDAIMIPTSAVSHLQAFVALFETVFAIPLTVVSLQSLINLNSDNQ
jgi:hypothetical protein